MELELSLATFILKRGVSGTLQYPSSVVTGDTEQQQAELIYPLDLLNSYGSYYPPLIQGDSKMLKVVGMKSLYDKVVMSGKVAISLLGEVDCLYM